MHFVPDNVCFGNVNYKFILKKYNFYLRTSAPGSIMTYML